MFMAGRGVNFEYDSRRIIALPTLRQLGLMIMAISTGLFSLAFFCLLYISFWWWCSYVIDLSNFFCDMFGLLFKVSYFVAFLGCWLGFEMAGFILVIIDFLYVDMILIYLLTAIGLSPGGRYIYGASSFIGST